MKKFLLASMLLIIAAPLASMEKIAVPPTPEKLLHELDMVGMQMVYQPLPLDIFKANALLDEAAKKIEIIKQIGSEQQLAEAKKVLVGMLNMYRNHLESPARKPGDDRPPPLLAPPPPPLFTPAPKARK